MPDANFAVCGHGNDKYIHSNMCTKLLVSFSAGLGMYGWMDGWMDAESKAGTIVGCDSKASAN